MTTATIAPATDLTAVVESFKALHSKTTANRLRLGCFYNYLWFERNFLNLLQPEDLQLVPQTKFGLDVGYAWFLFLQNEGLQHFRKSDGWMSELSGIYRVFVQAFAFAKVNEETQALYEIDPLVTSVPTDYLIALKNHLRTRREAEVLLQHIANFRSQTTFAAWLKTHWMPYVTNQVETAPDNLPLPMNNLELPKEPILQHKDKSHNRGDKRLHIVSGEIEGALLKTTLPRLPADIWGDTLTNVMQRIEAQNHYVLEIKLVSVYSGRD